jgi:hypothetical protein
MPVCAEERPAMRQPDAGHLVACHLYEADAIAA